MNINMKCFISDCDYKNRIKIEELLNGVIFQDVIKGMNLLPKLKEFYNEQYLTNACKAAIKNETSEEYNNCINDSLIAKLINTENILKLIAEFSSTLEVEYLISNKTTNGTFLKTDLYSDPKFTLVEKMYFKYLMPVVDNFVEYLKDDMASYLYYNKKILLVLMATLEVLMIFFCIITRIFIIKSLIHYLTISRCIMKILPTSVIINTPELESWIENKY